MIITLLFDHQGMVINLRGGKSFKTQRSFSRLESAIKAQGQESKKGNRKGSRQLV